MKHNGIELGEGSPLLTKGGRRRYLGPSEADIQKAAIHAIFGGWERVWGRGLYGERYPELFLLNALNPNKGGRKTAAAGIAKGMGLLADMPDLHLPVTRGPFLTLYIEVKRPGERPTKEQREMHALLRHEGHCVVWCISAQEITEVLLMYLAMPKNGIGAHPMQDDLLNKHLIGLREMWHHRLQPAPRAGRDA